MDVIVKSTLKTLKKSKTLLDHLTDDILSDSSVSPYHSTIGSHVRHILDFYECIFILNAENEIDLTARVRNKEVETKCETAIFYLNTIIEKLNNFEFKMDDCVIVIDDLGLGKTSITYTYGGLLSQANSHTIHHYAIINYIMEGLNIPINNPEFGYNPTSLRTITLN